MLNLHHLKIFQAVALLGSYSRAAEQLGISQPAVSMQVSRLEEALGVPLVTVRGRHVELTEAGAAMAEYAARIFRLSDEAQSAMEEFRGLRRGRLRLAASSTPGAYVLPGVVAAFRAAHSGVQVALQITNTRGAIRAVAEGLADLGVVGEAREGGADVELQPLCSDCLSVVVAPAHPWARAGTVSPGELAAEPLLVREEGSSTRWVLDRSLTRAGLKPRVAMELGSTEAVKEAAAAGLGAGVLSGWAVRAEVRSGRLSAVRVEGLSLERTLHLVLPRGAQVGALGTAFLEHLKAADLTGGCL